MIKSALYITEVLLPSIAIFQH